MRAIIISLFKQIIFWLLFFLVLRFIFLIYNQSILAIEEVSGHGIFKSFWYGIRTDFASISYIMVMPVIIMIFQQVWNLKWLNKVNLVFQSLMILVYSLITVAELGIYPEWRTKLSAKALLYLRRPDEAVNSISVNEFMSLLGLSLLLAAGGIYVFRKYFFTGIEKKPRKKLYTVIFSLIVFPLILMGIRGGVQPIPISPSAAYFSKHSILNHTALNSGFNLAISLLEYNKFSYDNPFKFLPEEEAKQRVANLFIVEKDTTISVLKTQKPNIVIILLESWSADLIESLGGEPGITPEFAKLEKNGILFTEHYSTGSRSQQAMASVLGGFPAVPFTTITENASKYSKLPSLTKLLKDEGYYSLFHFGGQLTYGNMKAYTYYNGFDKVVEEYDFPGDISRGRLGVHDEYLFSRIISDYNEVEQPFISMMLTLSSHSPYDQPMEDIFDWGGNENAFINSAYYTDRELGKFLREAKKQDWYSNTLFIIMADHSHNTYRNWLLESFNYHKVPLFFYGDVIKDEYRGNKIDKIVYNADVPKTLLNQMGVKADDFVWSKDIFNPYSAEFAFFELHYAYGWKERNGCFVYSWDWNHYYEDEMEPGLSENEKEQLNDNGEAFLQVLFQEFLDM